jgi:hypothetical protein
VRIHLNALTVYMTVAGAMGSEPGSFLNHPANKLEPTWAPSFISTRNAASG